MKKKGNVKTNLFILFGMIGLVCWCLFAGYGWAQEQVQDPTVHEAVVTAQLLPLFAVDKNGNPVYDLKVEEMELFVSGKATPITFFDGYQMDLQSHTTADKNSAVEPVKTPERICFIIMDTLITSANDEVKKYTWELAREIIKNGAPGDAFVLTRTHPEKGLIYLGGPTKNQLELLKMLDVNNSSAYTQERQMVNTFMRRVVGSERNTGDHGESRSVLADITMTMERAEKQDYKKDIRVLTQSLFNLKYALKSTMLPKVVYLISAQSKVMLLGNESLSAIRYLEDGAKAINYGGSLFYLINPVPVKAHILKNPYYGNLKFMADAAGGKLIMGTQKKDIVNQLKKNTSAYYEMGFNSAAKEGHKSNIRITCKRPGVSLSYLASSEQERSYAGMNEMERDLYVLNIINGGVWSKTTIPVHKLAYQATTTPQNTATVTKEVAWTMPANTLNHPFHFFKVTLDPQTQQASVTFSKKIATENERLNFTLLPGKKHYLVLIDELGSVSYCNEIL